MRAAGDVEDFSRQINIRLDLPIEHADENEIRAAIEGIGESGQWRDAAGGKNLEGDERLIDGGKNFRWRSWEMQMSVPS